MRGVFLHLIPDLVAQHFATAFIAASVETQVWVGMSATMHSGKVKAI